MRIRLRSALTDGSAYGGGSEYPIRPTSFLASLGIHFGIVFLLTLLSSPEMTIVVSRADEQLDLTSHRIIYYDFRQKLPDVSPPEPAPPAPVSRGAERSRRTVIATAPRAESNKQMIFLPAPEIEVQNDLPVPDLIARLGDAIPAPQAPPPPKPPPEPPKPEPPQPEAKPETPAPKPVPPPKAFVPPPPVERPKLPLEMIEVPAPPDASATSQQPKLAGIPQILAGAPPAVAAPKPPAPAGNSTVDVAVVNRDPTPGPTDQLPSAQRAGEFSSAPNKGEAAAEAAKGPVITAPNLTIRDDNRGTGQTLATPGAKPVIYAERVRSVPLSTLSVPLRPSSRTLPRSVEARFPQRNVYTMVVPIENLPAYGGDWILWFAEKTPEEGSRPVVRAPIPLRKFERLEPASGSVNALRIQLAATIERDGKLTQVLVLTASEPAVKKAVVEDLTSWEFKPATRNGMPVAVEAVFEIPFNLPAAQPSQSQP